MAMENTTETGRPVSRPDDLARRLRWVLLAVPGGTLLGGAAALARDLHLGIFATALILGWTQLVGL